MADTATSSIDFKGLSKRLYKHLLSDAISQRYLVIAKDTASAAEPVNCFLEDGVLMVIIHLAEAPSLETSAIFSCTREFLEKVRMTEEYPSKIYLLVGETSIPPVLNDDSVLSPLTVSFPQRDLSQSGETASPDSPSDASPSWGSLLQSQWQHLLAKSPAFLVNHPQRALWGLALGGSLLLAGFYVLSRSCVWGSCDQLNLAEASEDAFLFSFSLNDDLTTNWLTTKQQLTEARNRLEAIPFWSPYYGQATQLKASYQARIEFVDRLNQATDQVRQAELLVQNSPLSTTDWEKVKQHWEKAIALLSQLPADTPYQIYAQKQRQLYQQNRLEAQQRLLEERQAEQHFNKAQESAILAKMRSTSPKSLADLSLIATTWQEVVANLQQIRPGTTVYEEAFKQFPVYSLEYTKAKIRRQQEEHAQLSYQQALALAKLAEQAGLDQKWSIAVKNWQKALAALKQIPPQSFLMAQVRPLIATYRQSLEQAQNNLKNSLRSQNTKQELESLCSQWNRTCDYNVSPQGIKVRLTAGYVQQIWDSALQAKAQDSVPGQAGVLDHISQLEQTFQTISNQSGLPLEVYHAKGNRLTRYQPIR